MGLSLPSFYTDPSYKTSQAKLLNIGSNMLKGDLLDYYKPIGEMGGKDFEAMLNLVKADAQTSAESNVAKRNLRGGLASNIVTKSVVGASTGLRWQDYMRALTGRENLLRLGVSTTEGVRSAGLSYGNAKSQYDLTAALETQKMAQLEESEKEARKAALWNTIIGSAIGGISTVYGAKLMGSAGKVKGATSIGSYMGVRK